jgi:hypothetical protein
MDMIPRPRPLRSPPFLHGELEDNPELLQLRLQKLQGMGLIDPMALTQSYYPVSDKSSHDRMGIPMGLRPHPMGLDALGRPMTMNGLHAAALGPLGNQLMNPLTANALQIQHAMGDPAHAAAVMGAINPAMAMNGMNPAMAMNGMNPAMAMNGMNPSMAMNGMNPAMAMNGMNPAMAMNGMNPMGPNGMNPAMAMNGMNPMGPNGMNPAMAMNGMNPMGPNGMMNPAMAMNGMNPMGPNGMMNPMGQGPPGFGPGPHMQPNAANGMRGGPMPPQPNLPMSPYPPGPTGPPPHGPPHGPPPGGPAMGPPQHMPHPPQPMPPPPQPPPPYPPMVQPYGGGGVGAPKPGKPEKGAGGLGGKPFGPNSAIWQNLDIERLLSGSYVPLILVLLLAFVLRGR